MDVEDFVATLDGQLRRMLDIDPVKATEAACTLLEGDVNQRSVAAGILVDAGALTRDAEAIEKGINVFRELSQKYPQHPAFLYNLANGLVTKADAIPFKNLDWYLETSALRREGRKLLDGVESNSDVEDDLRSTAACNLANAFWKAHRWAEAYDAYLEALDHDPSNVIAQTGAARVLLRCAEQGLGKRSVLLAVAQRHLERSKVHKHRLKELGGLHAETGLLPLLESTLPGGAYPDLSKADDYQRFIARHRLALTLTIEGLDVSLKRWDSLQIASITEGISASGVPPLFAIFNVMKADYIAARYLAYKALHEQIPDSGTYADTLDYALYGTKQSLLTMAQRSCIDVLDKIAVATSEYLGLAGRHIYFSNRWFGEKLKGGALQWHPELGDLIKENNTALIALAEIALDIEAGGALHLNKLLRNASTHRVVVTHDIGQSASRASAFIEHYPAEEYERNVIRSLRLTRAALLYFVDMVAQREGSRAGKGFAFPMIVPQHHEIRGDDAE